MDAGALPVPFMTSDPCTLADVNIFLAFHCNCDKFPPSTLEMFFPAQEGQPVS